MGNCQIPHLITSLPPNSNLQTWAEEVHTLQPTSVSLTLNDCSGSHACSNAHGHHSLRLSSPLQFWQQSGDLTSASASKRVTKCNCATFWIELFFRDQSLIQLHSPTSITPALMAEAMFATARNPLLHLRFTTLKGTSYGTLPKSWPIRPVRAPAPGRPTFPI